MVLGALATLGIAGVGYAAVLAVTASGPVPTSGVVLAAPTPAPAAGLQTAPPGAQAASVAGGTLPTADPAWLARTAQTSGVPQTALAAYARAQLMSPPACHLGWTTLAGIGWVESQHGEVGGRFLEPDGRSSTPVLGPALDGRHGFAAMPATPESTAMSGDRRWVRAVGPMQFVPSTWQDWAADGDGDGVADPDDIDDAALTAARYLCAGGQDLATGSGWTAAVLSYNHSEAYLADVHAAAQTYADRTS